MKKTVLIPTDFSVDSLNTLKLFLNNYTNNNSSYNIILLHGYALPTGIPNLLFFSKEKTLEALTREEFKEVCMMIKNKFASKINVIRTDLFTGFNNAAFANYLEGNEVNEICFNSSMRLQQTSKNSFDLTKFINKSKIKLIDIVRNVETEIKTADEKNISTPLTNTVAIN